MKYLMALCLISPAYADTLQLYYQGSVYQYTGTVESIVPPTATLPARFDFTASLAPIVGTESPPASSKNNRAWRVNLTDENNNLIQLTCVGTVPAYMGTFFFTVSC